MPAARSTGRFSIKGDYAANFPKRRFIDPNLVRPFYWDIKNAIKELLSGTNTFFPSIGFSYRDKVACTVAGAVRYFLKAPAAQQATADFP